MEYYLARPSNLGEIYAILMTKESEAMSNGIIISTDVTVYLDDFATTDLVEELQTRVGSTLQDMEWLLEALEVLKVPVDLLQPIRDFLAVPVATPD